MKASERIEALLFVASRPISGFQIGAICNLGSYRLYYALSRLENSGTITSHFETGQVSGARRRLYQLRQP